MMIAVLTSSCNSPLDVRWMPGTNAGDFPQPFMCLSRQLLGSPSTCDTLETMAFGDSNAVNHLILLKDCVNLNWLFEESVTEIYLLRNSAAVHLDLHEMSFFLLERSFADLGMGED